MVQLSGVNTGRPKVLFKIIVLEDQRKEMLFPPPHPILGPALGNRNRKKGGEGFALIYFNKMGCGSRCYFRVNFAVMSRAILSRIQSVHRYFLSISMCQALCRELKTVNNTGSMPLGLR